MTRIMLIIGALAIATAGRVPTAGAEVSPAGAVQGVARARAAVTAPDTPGVRSLATTPPPAWNAEDPADSLYRAAREALNSGDYQRAAQLFARVSSEYPRSAYAGDAYYWQAFALYRVGGREELRQASEALRLQAERFPAAKTRGEAKTLAARVNGERARLGDASAAENVATTAKSASSTSNCARPSGTEDEHDDANDDDMKVAALNALMQMDAERALPILKQVLAKRDACSASLRRRAVWLVSQKRAPETTEILVGAARNDPDRGVRKQAVFWLGQVRTEAAVQALEDVLRGATDEELKVQAVHALVEQRSDRGLAAVRRIAEDGNASPKLREQAVFWLGQRRSQENADFLRALFTRLGKGNEADRKLQERVLFSLSQMREMGNDRWLLQIAGDPQYSVEVRKQALWTAGQAKAPAADLVAMYDRVPERELKEQAIWVLSQSRDSAAMDKLFTIARSDRDVELRKKALFWLGQSRDPRVQQLLLDIINQPD